METHLVYSGVLGASGATLRADIVNLTTNSCNSGGDRKFELVHNSGQLQGTQWWWEQKD